MHCLKTGKTTKSLEKSLETREMAGCPQKTMTNYIPQKMYMERKNWKNWRPMGLNKWRLANWRKDERSEWSRKTLKKFHKWNKLISNEPADQNRSWVNRGSLIKIKSIFSVKLKLCSNYAQDVLMFQFVQWLSKLFTYLPPGYTHLWSHWQESLIKFTRIEASSVNSMGA